MYTWHAKKKIPIRKESFWPLQLILIQYKKANEGKMLLLQFPLKAFCV